MVLCCVDRSALGFHLNFVIERIRVAVPQKISEKREIGAGRDCFEVTIAVVIKLIRHPHILLVHTLAPSAVPYASARWDSMEQGFAITQALQTLHSLHIRFDCSRSDILR